MLKIRKAIAITALAAITCTSVNAFAFSDITIKLRSVACPVSEIISFENYEPVQQDSTTYVPARTFAEAAGLNIDWDQDTQTATFSLTPVWNSEKPIEVYASKLMDKVDKHGLDLSPVNISAALKLNDNNVLLKYNFTDSDGDIVAIGKNIDLNGSARLVDDKALMVPIRNVCELFGLNVSWSQDDMSMDISIPSDEDMILRKDLAILPDAKPAEAAQVQTTAPTATVTSKEVTADAPVDTNPQLGEYIGRFKITHYAPGPYDNGIYGNATAWAGDIIPGQTIGVDPNIIPKLSWVYIEGYGLRRAEDCGSGVHGYGIDVAVSSVAEADRLGVVYRDVYKANVN